MLQFQLRAFKSKLLQRRRPIWLNWDQRFVLLLEPSATHLRVPLPESADQIGKWVRPGFGLRRTGTVYGLYGARYGWEFEETGEEEEQERETQHDGRGEDVEGLELQWHGGR